MKNKILYLLLVVAAVSTAGCSKKFLEEMKSYDKYDESIFTNEVQTGWFIDRLYNYYFTTYNSPTKTMVGVYDENRSNITEEIGAGGNVHNWINPNKNFTLASEADAYYGAAIPTGVNNNSYSRIRNCNFLIEKINTVGQALPESFRKTARGQMYFLRALQYFDLARVYGGVPIVTTVQQASAEDPTIKAPRAKSSEVFEQIVKDLDSAAALLPMKWENIAVDYGRLTAAGALAMKSRVLLTAASPLFNANWDNPGDTKWQKALAAGLDAETKLLAAGYGAMVTSAKTWGEATTTDQVGGANGEGLIVILLSNVNTGAGVNNGWENRIRPRDYNGSGGITAPKAMLDLFPLNNGLRPTAANGYNDSFFFWKRDPRFYRTFAFSGVKWPIKDKPNKSTWFYRWRASATGAVTYYANNQLSSPAVVRKMSNPTADSAAFNFSGTDIFDYRYGELLLNIAECYAATGNTAKAIEYLGKLRARVGIAQGADNWGIGSLADKYAALEAVLYERRVELAYEGKRFWDIHRWMLYADDASYGDDTNAKLGIPAINGTNRTGYYWQSKTFAADPLSQTEKNKVIIDIDNMTGSEASMDSLRSLVRRHFNITPLDQPMDRDGTPGVNILFRQNYYIQGLTATILSNNPWLPQTKGWKDYDGAAGTFDYRE